MKKGKGFLWIGLLLIGAALFLVGYNIATDRRAGKASEAALAVLKEEIPEETEEKTQQAEYELSPEFEMPTIEIEGIRYIGELVIPAIGLDLPIQSEYDGLRLQQSPCRYTGSVYTDDMVLSAHNYSYHFGRLSELKIGDEVRFIDVDGNRFVYKVKELETLKKEEYGYMTDGDGWDLTLFTCTLGGGARVTVRCEKETELH